MIINNVLEVKFLVNHNYGDIKYAIFCMTLEWCSFMGELGVFFAMFSLGIVVCIIMSS